MALTLLATNNAESTLASAISATDTSLIVSAGTGAEFPDAVAGESYFKLTLTDAATGSQVEIVNVTAKSGDIFTIERAQEGTLARAWAANDMVANMMTADTLNVIADFAKQASDSAEEAQGYALSASEFGDNKSTFADTAAGLAATTSGQYFRVPQGTGNVLAFRYYKNNSGVAQEVAEYPGQGSITNTIREFPTLAAAQADADAGNIPVGSTAYYRSPDDSALAIEVMNVGGTLQPTGRKMPSQKTVDDLLKHVETTNLIFQLVDILGYRQFYALTSGEFGTIKTRIKPTGIELEGYSLTVSDDNGIYIENILGQRVVLVDEYGNVAPRSLRAARDGSFGTDAAMVSGNGLNFNSGGSRIDITGPEFLKVSDFLGRSKTIIDASGNLVGGGSGGGITLQDRINILNAENLNYYSKVRSRYNADIERLVFALSMIIWYGQSLSTNQEGYPALSKTPYSNLGNLMLGNSPRPNTRTGAGFTPVGSAILNPLRAVVQSGDGSYVMSDADVAALPAGSGNEGEGAVAAVNMLRTLFLRQAALLTDPSRLLVLASCGVNGRTVEALSKGADPELYNRIREAVSKIKAIADGESKTFGIGAFCFLQGEWNYNPGYGGDYTREGYKAKVRQLYSDVIADFCSGQRPPAMFTYQTGGTYTIDTYELAIGMAQLDMATEGGNIYGVCPSYPFPNKDSGHLTSNGYRWMDMFFGKVMFRVLVLGEGWEPLHCTGVEVQDDYALLNYAVPYPPLQWGTPYDGRTAKTYADKGYRATDANGALDITAAEIVADTVVKLTFSRRVSGKIKIWYADKTSHNGNGCLKDSDPFLATENYVYTAGSGQYADENIPELVDKPYPLENWAWAQIIETTV
ncbi:hypothetical protein [Klebsiella pneumoniae]|uniref:hypothetical protein n=2 Tax=Klebsiella pneumoniae TaxID=573 RepID=UPI0006976DC8|nr:hypothetical protein [Klebsiella pneumoniae]MDT9907404.1 hypothetical protein [Klebsiella pneumoniae]QBI25403.1 hypothetical protein WN05_17115 [Klebsiella pneumoniae]VGD41233.1 flagellar biosynthesis, cell-distal portion of basal-body rod [Klebsiella pneumoniae]VGE32575.1 flagellar biosynthesis, cell-distal portion of basal-body rod [Klebsiella pneumoniae]HBV9611284.1 hypothetical protein [Klebsiella pneumoniae]